jgi:hypothetical protein
MPLGMLFSRQCVRRRDHVQTRVSLKGLRHGMTWIPEGQHFKDPETFTDLKK